MDDVFVDDGLHLNDKGNRIWATAIKSILMAIEAEFEMAKANGDQVDLDGDRSRVRDGESQRTVNGWEGSPQTGSSF